MAAQPYEISAQVEEYTDKAKTGDPSAQYMLARCYQTGWGVDKDEKKAAAFFQKAADQKHAAALSQLGACYETGFGIPKKDPKKAAECYKQAAESGDSYGEYLLGSCYEEGRCGIKKNEKMAVQLYQRAVAKKDSNQDPFFNLYFVQPSAYLSLGYCFEYGIGVEEQDLMLAGYYYKLAVEQQKPNATPLYEALKNKLQKLTPSDQKKTPTKPKRPVTPTPEQILKINKLKARWHSNLALLGSMTTVGNISIKSKAGELLIAIQAITDKELEETICLFEKHTQQTRIEWSKNEYKGSSAIAMLLFLTAFLTPDKLPPGVSDFIRFLSRGASDKYASDHLYHIWKILELYEHKILNTAQLQTVLANAQSYKKLGKTNSYLAQVASVLRRATDIGLNLTHEQNVNELIKIDHDHCSLLNFLSLMNNQKEKLSELLQPAFSFFCSLQQIDAQGISEQNTFNIVLNNMETASWETQKECLNMLIQRPSIIPLLTLLPMASYPECLEMLHNYDKDKIAFILSQIKEMSDKDSRLRRVKLLMSIPRDCLIEPVVKNFIASLPIGDEKMYQQGIEFVQAGIKYVNEKMLGSSRLGKLLEPIPKDCKDVSAFIESKRNLFVADLWMHARMFTHPPAEQVHLYKTYARKHLSAHIASFISPQPSVPKKPQSSEVAGGGQGQDLEGVRRPGFD